MEIVTRVAGDAIISSVVQLMTGVINEDNRNILQIDLQRMQIILQDIDLFRDQQKAPPETLKIWLQLLQNAFAEAKRLLDRSAPRQSCLDCVMRHPRRLSNEVREWNAFFDHLYHGFESDVSILVTSLHFVSSKPLYKEDALYQGIAASSFVASEITDAQPLSGDEAWMLFRRVAFKEDQVSMNIEERAKKIADECRGLPLAINVVAAAMIGQTSEQDWDNCLSSMKNVDPSFPATHPRLHAELYARLRYGYDALPNSAVKRCFLYCAMYKEDEEIETHTLLQMWIGEGLVKSKQGTYIMDMAIGRKYLKLLVDRCLFHRVTESMNVFKRGTIRVHNYIRDMAIYIGQKDENCLFMASQDQQNFPEVHNENCSRISVANNFIEDLPAELRCPKLASLNLEGNRYLKELPSEFLLSLTSVRVLNLSSCSEITSIPASIGQLRMLEFLSIGELPIKELPEEICHLSRLQFLHLSFCECLESLPSNIAELKNLKHLNLGECDFLKMIPHEISELTSLNRLQLNFYPGLSVEMEAPASIWSLKGLKNLTELQVWIDTSQDGNSRIKDGIMGTWSEMRHLCLCYRNSFPVEIMDGLLPQDMQNMRKLQSFMMEGFQGLSLPNCKFEHLEMVKLRFCHNIRELSPLQRLPNLKLLMLEWFPDLKELGIGNPSGYLKLEKLVLKSLDNLESLGGPSNTGVWDERTLPHLRVLKIINCESLKIFPSGMEKLRNLCTLIYQRLNYLSGKKSAMEWWESIRWEDDNMKLKFQKIFQPCKGK